MDRGVRMNREEMCSQAAAAACFQSRRQKCLFSWTQEVLFLLDRSRTCPGKRRSESLQTETNLHAQLSFLSFPFFPWHYHNLHVELFKPGDDPFLNMLLFGLVWQYLSLILISRNCASLCVHTNTLGQTWANCSPGATCDQPNLKKLY